jgi:hypothetical protein
MTVNDGRITDLYPDGHIPLRCKNHPDKRWSTKNISHIGARSIFYNLDNDPTMGEECACYIRDLEVVAP